ncbi:MAG: radical SAM protein [Nitrospirota bacterium]
MNVLLINPLTPERRMIHNTPNLGLGYLAAALRKRGFHVDMCDGMKTGMSYEKLRQRLLRGDYDVAGVQVLTCTVKRAKAVLGMIKGLNPEIITVIGGPHPSGDPEGVLNDIREADFSFRGEGEEGLPELLKKLRGDKNMDFADIHNLVWRVNGKVIANPLQPVQDLDSVGLPSWDLINPHEYPYSPIGAFARRCPLTTISCSRGCAHSCTFCANTRIMGKQLRTRGKASILEEIRLLYSMYGIREFQIVDDCFTSNKQNAIDVCREIIKSGLDISISFPNGVRIESLDEELLHYLELAGCYSLGMAIESGSQRIMDHMRRGQTLALVEEKVSLVKKTSKIRMSGFFIIGYPEEEEDDILRTIGFAKKLPLHRANFTLWMPVPGSEMTERLRKDGRLKDLDTDNVVINKISWAPGKIEKDRIRKLFIKAYSSFYLRPKILIGLLTEIRNFEQLKFILSRVFCLFSLKSG